ncbi:MULTISPECIES: hypothetical protein [Anaerotruncus]|nr:MULTISPECIES: hypothetical protein [Anaerotruncus]
MFGTILWFSACGGFFHLMMRRCRQAAAQGYRDQQQFLRARRG